MTRLGGEVEFEEARVVFVRLVIVVVEIAALRHRWARSEEVRVRQPFGNQCVKWACFKARRKETSQGLAPDEKNSTSPLLAQIARSADPMA